MTVMERLANSIVVPVVVLDKVEDAVPTAKAMAAGGVDTMEITFRTACAPECIKAVAENCPDVLVGAGTIITRNHTRVTGLTTAAGLWATACLGLAIGAGFYAGAIAAWLLMTVTITIFTRLEHGIKQSHSDTYYLELSHISHVNEFVSSISDQVSSIQVLPAKSGIPEHIGLEIVTPATESSAALLTQLQSCDYVLMAVPVAQEY